jgi:hypothetical protein
MRKTCAKVVDVLKIIVESEHHLYSGSHNQSPTHVVNSLGFPTTKHILSKTFPTANMAQINLLHNRLSTLYTGLITNITRDTFNLNSYSK